MLLKIDFEIETPIYMQIRNEIVKGIAKGQLDQEESLPSVRVLASEIGVNMHTVNKAYTLLKDEGFLTMDRRKGAFISKLNKNITDKYLENLNDKLEIIAAEAILKGMKNEDFIKVCEKSLNTYDKGGFNND
ncbi:GntR family transcriptional regulator [Clostridium sp. DL1XJH146]